MNKLFNSINCAEIPFNCLRFTWRKSLSSTDNIYEKIYRRLQVLTG